MVTKYNKPYALISKPGKSIDTSIETFISPKKSIDTSIDKQPAKDLVKLQHVIEEASAPRQINPRCQYPLTPCHTEGQQYKATVYEDSGEITKDMYLCDKHKAEMQKKGLEING